MISKECGSRNGSLKEWLQIHEEANHVINKKRWLVSMKRLNIKHSIGKEGELQSYANLLIEIIPYSWPRMSKNITN